MAKNHTVRSKTKRKDAEYFGPVDLPVQDSNYRSYQKRKKTPKGYKHQKYTLLQSVARNIIRVSLG
jgi:hypothetical protein